jgi:hypothetical protein
MEHWFLPAILIPLYLAGMASYLGVWYWVAIDRFPLVRRERLVVARAEFLMSDREFQLWVEKTRREIDGLRHGLEWEHAIGQSREEHIAAWRQLGWLIQEVERYLPSFDRRQISWEIFEPVVTQVQGYIHRLYELRPPRCDAFIGQVEAEVRDLRPPYAVTPDFRLREVALDRVSICVILSLALGETMPPELLLHDIQKHIEAKVRAVILEKWGNQSFIRRK